MREIDTRTYISTLRELVREGHDVNLIISGSSMAPFLIHHRDTIIFGPVDRPLKRGDMVFYERPSGQFVMHRIRKVGREGLYLIGDAQTETEGPLPKALSHPTACSPSSSRCAARVCGSTRRARYGGFSPRYGLGSYRSGGSL